MSTEETQQVEEIGTEVEQQDSTITEELEAGIKGEQPEIEITDEDIAAELEAVKEALQPPPKWDRRYKDAFADLGSVEKGREYQQAMLDLYTEQQGYATQIEQERAALRRFADPLREALDPYQQMIAASGASPDQMVRQAMGLVMSLSQNPQGTILGLARKAGIDLTQLGENAPYVDPETQKLRDELTAWKRESQQREMRQAQESRARLEAQVNADLNAFASAKDEQGTLKHPHIELEAVQRWMTTFIKGDSSISLDEAYQAACKQCPEVAQAEADAKAAREAATRAAKAKKEALAAQRVSGKPGVEAAPEGSIEDELKKQFRAQSQAA